jgi:type II secretory pathway component PulF
VSRELTPEESAELAFQVAALAKAGLPLPAALEAVAGDVGTRRLGRVLRHLAGRLAAGVPLEQAVAGEGARLPAHFCGLLLAGVRSGRLAPTLDEFVDVTYRGEDLRRRVSLRLLYPAGLVALLAVFLAVIFTWLIPQFAHIFRDFNTCLPALTYLIIHTSPVLVWTAAGVALLVPILLVLTYLAPPGTGWLRLVSLVPLIGPLVRATSLARFCQLMAMLVDAGVPAAEALRLAAAGVPHPGLAAAARRAAAAVEAGRPLDQALAAEPWFPPTLTGLAAWGRQTNSLGEAFRSAGEMFEGRGQDQGVLLQALAPPLALVTFLVLVGLMVVALFLPLTSVICNLSGGGVQATAAATRAASLTSVICNLSGGGGGSYGGGYHESGSGACGSVGPGDEWLFVLSSRLVLLGVVALVLAWLVASRRPHRRNFLKTLPGVLGCTVAALGAAMLYLEATVEFLGLVPAGSLGLLLLGIATIVATWLMGGRAPHRRNFLKTVPGVLGCVFLAAGLLGLCTEVMAAILVVLVVGGVLHVAVLFVWGRRRAVARKALLRLLTVSAERSAPLVPAMEALARERRWGAAWRARRLGELLAEGRSLPDAVAAVPGVLSPAALPLVAAGAQAGRLPAALRQAVAAEGKQETLWQSFMPKVAYVCLVLPFAAGVISFLVGKIGPQLEKIFKDFAKPLPSASQFVFSAAAPWILSPLTLLAVLALLLLLVYMVLRYAGVIDWDLPGVGRLTRRLDTAAVLDALALAADAGQPLVPAVQTLAATYPRRAISRRLSKAAAELTGGGDWSASLQRHGLVGKADQAILDAAARAGNLGWAMREVAEGNRRRFAYRVQGLLQVLFPAAVVAFGLVVLLAALAIFLPLVYLIQGLAGA